MFTSVAAITLSLFVMVPVAVNTNSYFLIYLIPRFTYPTVSHVANLMQQNCAQTTATVIWCKDIVRYPPANVFVVLDGWELTVEPQPHHPATALLLLNITKKCHLEVFLFSIL